MRRVGPIPFDELLELALYHPSHGFYARGGRAGRRGDFLTSPEVGPLFGAAIARALDTWWTELGRPDPFVVVEAGAGAGTLARAVLDAAPGCSRALHYVLVERAERLRERQRELLPLEPARMALGPAVVRDPEEGVQQVPGTGPVVTALADLPATPVRGVVLANELLDDLPFRLLERRAGGWSEVRVGDDLDEVVIEATPALAAQGDTLAPGAPVGARIPLQLRAMDWLRRAIAVVERGRVVVVDYAATTPSMAERPWTEWVRTYRGHARGTAPLSELGGQDVTCEVALDQLAHVRPPTSDQSQAEFLAAHGLDQLRERARARWQERAAIGDLEAVKARSRVSEAEALVDPAGLGAFRVLQWVR